MAGSVGAQANPEWIRVAVVQDDPQVTLQIRGGFTISALQTGERIQQGSRLHPTDVRAVADGLAWGERVLPVFGVRVEPVRDATITLNGQRLRGTLEIVRNQQLKLLVVNHVALEDYLQGVLSKEMPHYWPMEALKAVAITARTYAVYQRLTKEGLDYDVTGDVMSQDYGGRSAEKGQTTRAVKFTRGLVLTTAQGQIFPPFYHSTCGGLTEDAVVMGSFDLAPLKGRVACAFCRESPFYRWVQQLSPADVAWALKQQGRGSFWPVEDMQVSAFSPTGRVATVRIRSASGRELTLSGYEFRKLFGFERIRSTAFAIVRAGDQFVLQGHGWGHGVGLCQWGSAELARRGLSAEEIVHVYYPTAELARLGESDLQPIPVQEGM